MDDVDVWQDPEGAKPPPVGDTPLPKKEMFVTACIYLSESFANSMLFPFVAFMVWDFGVTDSPTEVGFYAGMLASSFSFAQFISSFWWGVWSDKVGRKRVLMVGMAGSLVSVLMFGLSVNFAWALITRTIHGLLNGNLAVARSYIGDVTDNSNQARAMSVTSLIYGLGVILGPTVGGFLSQPTQKYGALFPPDTFHGDFLEQFPYFLPCLVSTLISATGMVGGFLYLEDKKKPDLALVIDEAPTPRRQSLYGAGSVAGIIPVRLTESGQVIDEDDDEADKRLKEELQRELDLELAEAKERLLAKIREDESTKKKKRSFWEELRLVTKEVDLVISALLYGLLTFSVLVFVEIFSLWAINKPEVGGLDFSSADVGAALAVVGLTVVVFQLFIYPKMEKRFGSLIMFRVGMSLLVPVFILFPALNLVVPLGEVVLWALVIPLSVVRALGATLSYTSVFVLINNTASPETRGAANGFSEAVASIAKTVGPVAGGALFAWSLTNDLSFPFNHYFMFLVLSTSAAIGVLLSLRLTRSRVDGSRQSAGEAKGLLRDWREKEQLKANSRHHHSTAAAAAAAADSDAAVMGSKRTLGDTEDHDPR